MNNAIRKNLENYILDAAETPHRPGTIPINAWSLLGGKVAAKMGGFDEIFADGGIDALTRPLKISVGSKMESDWAGLLVHSFRQVRPMQILPARPAKTPMLEMYDRSGRRQRKVRFCKTQGSTTGLPVSLYTVEASSGGLFKDRKRSLFFDYYLISKDGSRWAVIHKSGVYCDESDADMRDQIKAAIGLQCFTEYCWTVEFSFDNNSMPILFPVGMEEARRLVADTQNVSEGERRKKVIHFVQAHKRFTKREEEPPSSVMSHVRGCMFYVWQGCKLKVMPPVNNLYSFERNTKKIQSVRKAVFASQ